MNYWSSFCFLRTHFPLETPSTYTLWMSLIDPEGTRSRPDISVYKIKIPILNTSMDMELFFQSVFDAGLQCRLPLLTWEPVQIRFESLSGVFHSPCPENHRDKISSQETWFPCALQDIAWAILLLYKSQGQIILYHYIIIFISLLNPPNESGLFQNIWANPKSVIYMQVLRIPIFRLSPMDIY